MKKPDLIKKVAETAGCTQVVANTVLVAFADVVKATLGADENEKVTLPDVGTFKVKKIPERTGTIILGDKKGEKWYKPAHDEIAFCLMKSFKKLGDD